MAKQTPTIKNPSQQDAIAKAKAGKSMKSELAQGARKPLSQEELDKLNAKAVDAQQADIVADASNSGAAQTAEAGTIGSASEAGAAAGTISPLAIGAGVLGVVAIAAASGGSSGGSSSSNNQPLADGSKQNQNTQDQGKGTDTVTDGAAGGTGGTGAGTGGTGSAGAGGSGAGTGTTEPGKQDPVPPQYGQAIAEGTPKAPTVSPDGETKLSASKAAFAEKLAEAGKTEASQQFIRIDRILAAEGSEPEARLVRYPENDAQGVAVKPKAPDAAAAAPSQLTAYEVIKVEGGITLADAKAAAEKLGGKLMMVNDAAEAKWLDDAFKNFLGENTGAADLAKNGAWIGGHAVAGDGKFDAAIRAEGEQATKIHYFDHGAEKLNAFVVEFDNYQHPLTLNGKPVAEGQVINAEDFDKLVWNANANQGGKIKFSVVDSAEATEPGKIEGDLVITESASVTRPTIPAGTGGNTTPDAGNNTPADPNAGSNTNDQPGNSGSTGGSNNAGGSTGSGGNTPKPLPTYPHDAATFNVTENKADAKLDKSLFTGTDEAKAPEFVKILTLNLPGLASDIGDKTALFITHSDKVEHIANDTPEFILHKSLFDKISWNASLANGGSFTFVPVADDKGTEIPGAKIQTVTINETPAASANPADGQQTPGSEQPVPGNEQQPGGQQNQDGNPQGSGGSQQNPDGGQQGPGGSPSSPDAGGQAQTDGQQEPQKAAPEYSKEALSANVEHDKADFNFSAHKADFEGTGNTKATHIKISEIKKNGSDPADEGTLKYEGTAVNANTVIDLTKLNLLVWDASKAEGGSFKFTPVADAQGTAIDGAMAHSMTMKEADAPPPAPKVPTYGDALTAEVGHNKANFDFASHKAHFEGTGETKATHIKISEIKNGAGDAAATEGTLKYEGTAVNATTVIDLTKLNLLVWDASQAEGGSFKFTPVADAQGTAIDGATAQSVTINEAQAPQPLQPEAPTYANEVVTSTVETHNKADHKFTEILAKLEGTGNKATHIKITEIKNGTAGSPEAEEGTLKYKDANVGSNANNLIALNELDQLVWDASKAVGGSFKFTAVQANGEPFANPPAEQTVSINEPLHTPTPEQKEVAKYGQTTLEKALFDSSVEGNTNPEFVKIISITPTADDTAAKRVVNESTKTAYQVVKVDKGISLAEAEQAAKAMGGKLLEISNQDELDFIKGDATLMGKLNQFGEDTDSAKKGAWFKNPDANQAAAANGKEGIFSTGTAEDNVQFVDVEASSGKLNAYIVEFSDYDSPKPALLVGDESSKKAVSDGQALDKDELGKLSWDSMFNSGGEVKFIEVTAKQDGQNARGAVENTLTITEADVTGTLLQDHVIL